MCPEADDDPIRVSQHSHRIRLHPAFGPVRPDGQVNTDPVLLLRVDEHDARSPERIRIAQHEHRPLRARLVVDGELSRAYARDEARAVGPPRNPHPALPMSDRNTAVNFHPLHLVALSHMAMHARALRRYVLRCYVLRCYVLRRYMLPRRGRRLLGHHRFVALSRLAFWYRVLRRHGDALCSRTAAAQRERK